MSASSSMVKSGSGFEKRRVYVDIPNANSVAVGLVNDDDRRECVTNLKGTTLTGGRRRRQ